MFHKLGVFILLTVRSGMSLFPAGAQASDPGGGRRLPFRGGRRHGPGDLRLRLGDTSAEPHPVRVVWQHSLWTSAPRRRGQAEGTAQHIGELHDGWEGWVGGDKTLWFLPLCTTTTTQNKRTRSGAKQQVCCFVILNYEPVWIEFFNWE